MSIRRDGDVGRMAEYSEDRGLWKAALAQWGGTEWMNSLRFRRAQAETCGWPVVALPRRAAKTLGAAASKYYFVDMPPRGHAWKPVGLDPGCRPLADFM